MIYVVLWSYSDDWNLVGAASDEEAAKQLKRDFVEREAETQAERDVWFKEVSTIPCEDGKIWRSA